MPCFLVPWGQQHVDSSIAAILIATVPIFTLIFAPLFVKEESWSLLATLGVLIGFVGVVVLLAPNIKGNWLANVVGELAILGAALGWSLSLIMMRRLPDVPPVLAMRNIFMIASVPLVMLALIWDTPWTLDASSSSLLSLLALGVFCGGLAYAMFIYSVGRTGPTFTSLVGYLVALFGVFFGIALLGDKMQTNDYVALTLIIAALGVARLKRG